MMSCDYSTACKSNCKLHRYIILLPPPGYIQKVPVPAPTPTSGRISEEVKNGKASGLDQVWLTYLFLQMLPKEHISRALPLNQTSKLLDLTGP